MRALGLLLALLPTACSFKLVDGVAPTDGQGVDGAPGMPFRKKIAIDPTRVNGAQVQFPVWILLAADADLKAHAGQDGSDIYFTSVAGAPLPYEIQRWTKSSGRLEAWVRADLNDTADTVIELRYGDRSRAPGPNPAMVFSNRFTAVWHLDDPLDTPAVADATTLHPGTAGGLNASDQVPSQLGGGVDFDGTSQRISFTTLPLTGNSDHTISAWVNQRAASGVDTIVQMGNAGTNQARLFHAHFGSSAVSTGFFTTNDWLNITDVDAAGWVLLHWTYRSSNRQSHLYRDGGDAGNHTFNTGVNTQGADNNLGYAAGAFNPAGGTPCALNGVLDEVRISNVERSPGWIDTEHENQSSPQTFYRVAAEEPAP